MRITKIILSVFIVLSLVAIGYLYKDITTVSYDWLGEGKTFFILSCISLSLILLRFSLVNKMKSNGISIVFAIGSVLISIYLTKHLDLTFKLSNYLLFAFLIQSTWGLWIKLFQKKAKSIEKFAFVVGPLLIGFTLITGWFSSAASIIIGASLLALTIISLILLFRKEPI